MSIKERDYKTFNVRMNKDLWTVLKFDAITKGVTMNSIIIQCVEKYKKNLEKKQEKKLTDK